MACEQGSATPRFLLLTRLGNSPVVGAGPRVPFHSPIKPKRSYYHETPILQVTNQGPEKLIISITELPVVLERQDLTQGV